MIRLEVYNIVIEFDVTTKLLKLITEKCSRANTGKHVSDCFHVQNGLEQGDDLPPLLFNFSNR
jgi:hypothetical protein